MTGETGDKTILFTAFEPSGDDHAAAVIRELKRRRADLKIFAWGGPKMARAGAEIIATTGTDAVVGVPGWDTIKRYLRIKAEIRDWMKTNRPDVLVPVDSPGANFTVARMGKRLGIKVVHLVAPQLWAWGPWRIGKLRRRTDLVLCLLPFEAEFFAQRRVPSRFIGHPLFDEPLDLEELDQKAQALPEGSPKLAMLPGSREAELRRNFPVLLEAFRELRGRHPGLVGVVGATTEEVRAQLQSRAAMLGGWPEGLDIVVGETDLVTRWSDVALVVSGTVTLQLAKQGRPMVILYKTNELTWKAIGRWLITTPFVGLPNLIAGREVVTELFPYFKGHARLTDAADALLSSAEAQAGQKKELGKISARFSGKIAASEAASALEEMLGLPVTGVSTLGSSARGAESAAT